MMKEEGWGGGSCVNFMKQGKKDLQRLGCCRVFCFLWSFDPICLVSRAFLLFLLHFLGQIS